MITDTKEGLEDLRDGQGMIPAKIEGRVVVVQVVMGVLIDSLMEVVEVVEVVGVARFEIHLVVMVEMTVQVGMISQ